VTFVAVQGDPYLELVRIADQVRADVVVVGASTKRAHRLAGFAGDPIGTHGRWPVTRGAMNCLGRDTRVRGVENASFVHSGWLVGFCRTGAVVCWCG